MVGIPVSSSRDAGRAWLTALRPYSSYYIRQYTIAQELVILYSRDSFCTLTQGYSNP